MSGAYLTCRKDAISGTLKMLKHYRAFIRSDSRYTECRDLQNTMFAMNLVGKDVAQARLWTLVNTAINRKPCETMVLDWHWPQWHLDLWRDQQLVQHLMHGNNPSGLQWLTWHPRYFRTWYMQRRYGHVLAAFWKQYEE